jgi:hypothetical protein
MGLESPGITNFPDRIMKSIAVASGVFAMVVMLTACDNIFGVDNYAAPTSTLAGRLVFEGQPVGVRSNGVQLELWEPGWELNQKIPVHVDQDGTFAAALFDGDYEINLLRGNGPWQNDPTRRPIQVRGTATIDIPVQPFYVIRNEQIAFDPAGGGPHGTIRATFNVGQLTTSPALEYVGVYMNGTNFVDRINSIPIPNAQRERARAQILTQLNANSPITINVNLPDNIYQTGSPARREYVFVRVGVKTVGVAEMLFSPVYRVAI